MLALFSTIKPQTIVHKIFIIHSPPSDVSQRIDFPQLTRRHVAKRRGLRGRKTRNGPFSSFLGPSSFFSYPPPISALGTQATIVYARVPGGTGVGGQESAPVELAPRLTSWLFTSMNNFLFTPTQQRCSRKILKEKCIKRNRK